MDSSVSLADVVKTVGDLGVIGLLLVVMWGGVKRWWVFGWTYEQIIADRNEWKDLAMRGSNVAERAVATAARVSGNETQL